LPKTEGSNVSETACVLIAKASADALGAVFEKEESPATSNREYLVHPGYATVHVYDDDTCRPRSNASLNILRI